MNYDEFTGQVQHRLELPNTGKTVRAIRATLMTLGERLQEGEATDLAGPLPMEIDWYLTGAVDDHGQRFDWDEFVERVWEREGFTDPEDRGKAAYHARVVMDVIDGLESGAEMQQVRDQLPAADDWDELFQVVDSHIE
ncbi:DUF2267 domain-containing protein [Halobacteriales archaeon Cl-PHB]